MKSFILALIISGWIGSATAEAQNSEPPFGYPPLTVFSLFQEEHRNKAYDMAIVYGRYLIENHPTELEGHPRYRGDNNFRRMIDIYNHYADEASDPTIREAYLDSSLQLYNRVFDIFSDKSDFDEYRWVFQRGRFYQTYANNIQDGMQLAYDDYLRMFELDSQRTTETANGYYVQITLQNMVRQGDRDQALRLMEVAEPHANTALLNVFSDTRNDLFRNPEERIGWLEDQLAQDPNNYEIIEELFELYLDQNMRQKAQNLGKRLYDNDPSYTNIMRMANLAQREGNYREANRFLNESISKTSNRNELKKNHLQISDNLLSLRELEAARAAARRAIQIDANWGEPYLKIANIYAQAVRSCTGRENLDRQDKVVYWLVLDYLDRARQVDASTSNQVRRSYSAYEASMPTPEEKFYSNWETGNKIKVDGSLRSCYSWINEETTVR